MDDGVFIATVVGVERLLRPGSFSSMSFIVAESSSRTLLISLLKLSLTIFKSSLVINAVMGHTSEVVIENDFLLFLFSSKF